MIPFNHAEGYVSPTLRIIDLRIENAVCGNPLPGGNEDFGYGDCDKGWRAESSADTKTAVGLEVCPPFGN